MKIITWRTRGKEGRRNQRIIGKTKDKRKKG